MLQAERHEYILSALDKTAFVSVENLMEQMHASRSTIRRDLLELEQMNRLIRTRGGAISNGKKGTSHEPEIEFRKEQQREEKQLIAQTALRFIHERDTILLDSGTTVIELAKLLGRYNSLMVATYDLYIANALSEMSNIDLVVTGGVLRRRANTLIGYFSEKIINEIHADTFFLSADAVDINHGCMCYNIDEIPVKKAMIKAAREVILLADHTKFETIAFINVCLLDEVDVIITGKEIDPDIYAALREMGKEIILVDDSADAFCEE